MDKSGTTPDRSQLIAGVITRARRARNTNHQVLGVSFCKVGPGVPFGLFGVPSKPQTGVLSKNDIPICQSQ